MTDDRWIQLARLVTASEREYARRAEQKWQSGDVLEAVRLRGIALGLEIARDHQLDVSQGKG